jgi:potassium-transporting ATPase KdpC subunit
MFSEALKQLRTGSILLIVMSVLTGILYPGFTTLLGQLFFPYKANGSIVYKGDMIAGSSFIGQSFTDNKYFWGRPSATTPYPYNAESSGGSNLDPINDTFLNIAKERVIALRQADFSNDEAVPVELVTASGSGLDPEISPYAAMYQAHRIAGIRQVPQEDVERIIKQNTRPRLFGIFGEARVNVLRINMALDELQTNSHPKE